MDAPSVRYATASDGTRIAFATRGEGPPLVYLTIPAISHAELAWGVPELAVGFRVLTAGHRLISVDLRGSGLSTRKASDYSVEAFVDDVAAVVDALGLEQFDMVAQGIRCPIAVKYAVLYPARIGKLVLHSPSLVVGAGWIPLMRSLREGDFGAYLRTMAQVILGADTSRVPAIAAFMSQCVDQEELVKALESSYLFEMAGELARISCPVFVVDAVRGDQVAFDRAGLAAAVASAIPNARLAAVEANGISARREAFAEQSVAFLDEGRAVVQTAVRLSRRESEVFELLALGKTNLQIADALVISPYTVARHVSSIFAKTGATNRTEAARFARELPSGQ